MRRFTRFVDRLRAGEEGAALEELGRVGGLLRGSGLKLPERFVESCVDAFLEMFRGAGRLDLVVEAAGAAGEALGRDGEWTFAKGEALFSLGRFDEAKAVLETLAGDEVDEPMVPYLLACIAEREGEAKGARRLFDAAHRLDPATCGIPLPVTEEDAIAIYRECLAGLPEPIARRLEEVPIFVDDLPSDELIHMDDPPLDPLVLGVFLGQTAGEERSPWPDDQPRIVLFHRNIGKMAGDREALAHELRVTLFHEVGHALGFDETSLGEMGLA